MGKHGRRDIGVTHDVLWRADQIGPFKTADFDKGVVAVSDAPVNIGGGDKFLRRRE